MSKVWLVGISNAETTDIMYACSSKEKAVARWEEIRQDLIKEFEELIESIHEYMSKIDKTYPSGTLQIFERCLKNLHETDIDKLNNYPHDEPYMKEMEIE